MSATELGTAPWEVRAADFPTDAGIDERARFLLRYAILAPSSHNSQPWSFAVDGSVVEVYAAESRWLAVADDDRRELQISLGCAVENLRIAAANFGIGCSVEYVDDAESEGSWDEPVVTVRLEPGASVDGDSVLFEAITDRRTEHGPFEDRPVPSSVLDRLGGVVREFDAELHVVADGPRRERLAELQAEADEHQMDDPAYRRELGHWIGLGALGASWLAARVGQVAVTVLDLGEREGRKNSRFVERAPVVAVLATATDTVEARVRTGRAFERATLAATREGLAVHPMSQVLERPDSKAAVADLLDLDGAVPQHLFRMGYPAETPGEHTPRWPVSTVLR